MDEIPTSAGHWYAADGSPAYSVKAKSGQDRPTTLADARKLNLYPSVTTILKMEAKPNLERWKIEQACLSCITLPRKPSETHDEFMTRALEDSKAQAIAAAERGRYLHGLCEKHLQGETYSAINDDAAIIRGVMQWLEVNFSGAQWYAERSFTHTDLGYGGKIDLYGQLPDGQYIVVDYKFKDFKTAGKRMAYDEHITQLAAYANGLKLPSALCVNLFVSSTTPGQIVPHQWKSEERDIAWEAFQCLLRLFQLRKGYKP